MIIKRNNQIPNQEIEEEIKQPSTINPSLRKEFKTWEEEAKYVIGLLKEQGIDIYDKNRYGGMYLNSKKNNLNHIFGEKKNKKPEDTKEVNNIDNQSLSNFFKK